MTHQEKIDIIYKDITKNYDLFCSQAKIKLHKHKKLIGQGREFELVSDVIFSILDKLKNPEVTDRFYEMTVNDKFRLYVLKSINTNTSYLTGPFLREQLKISNRIIYFDDKKYFLEQIPQDQGFVFVDRLAKENYEETIVKEIHSMLEYPRAEKVFGKEDWKYYSQLFKLYVTTDLSYKGLSDKYKIPRSSIAFHIRVCKDAIRNELKKTGLL